MGKVFKKVRKVVAKYDLGHQYGKKMGLPDPSGDLFYGSDKALSPAETADKLAKTQLDLDKQQADRQFTQQQQQAVQQTQEANYQAQASAQAIQLAADRKNIEAQVEGTPAIDTSEVDVDLVPDNASARRKRFSSTSANAGEGGPAIRI